MRQRIRSLRLAALASGLLLLLLPTHAPAQGVSFTFDADLEGWKAVGIDIDFVAFPPALNSITLVQNDGDMVHEAAGGNPGGFARLTDAIEEPASFAAAPDSLLNGGDLSPLVGGTLSFDHRLFETGEPNAGIAPYAVLFISGDPTDLNVLVWSAPAPSGPTDWVHFDIPLSETELELVENVPLTVLDPTAPSITPAQLGFRGTMTSSEIIANVDELLVAFELVNNQGNQRQERGGIDNVQIVPEPGALALAVLGAVLLGSTWRRRRP